jgi:hypothetical protein
MGPRAKVQMLLDINNPTNTLVGCEYQVTKVLARKWWKTFGKVNTTSNSTEPRWTSADEVSTTNSR